MRKVLLCLVVSFSLALPGACQELAAFSYPDTDTARLHWEPQFGSLPARVEAGDDGETHLALDANFTGPGSRACWDWIADIDLSAAGRVTFEISATNGHLARNVMVYFGTPNGWYAHSLPAAWTWPVADQWIKHDVNLASFGREGAPDGWGQVTSFRFSVWSNGPGAATFRLRNMQALPRNPHENYIANGSFDIPGVGIPYAWGSGHWGVGHMPWAADMDLWRRHWGLDYDVAYHGGASLRIRSTPDLPRLIARSNWFTPPGNIERLVASAWLKSDVDGLPVVIRCGQQSTTVEVGTEWSQFMVNDIEPATSMTLTFSPTAPGTLWIDAVQVQEGDEPTEEFHPASRDEALALREAGLDWTHPRRTDEVAAGRVTTGPVEAATVAIDDHGRFTLDGEPYLQHSFGLEYVSSLDVINAVATAGFRDICIEVRPQVTTPELRDIFDRCAEVGLRVIPWMHGGIPRERLADHITALKDHPALLCWYVYDEPAGDRFAEADARYALAKELDPDRPAFINYLPWDLEGQTGDIYSTDVYPIPHSTPMSAIQAVATMKAAAEQENKPVWMWLQGTGYAYGMAREPTPRELSCMVYGSLIAGARGIYYFAQFPLTPECMDEMRALVVELDALSPALGSLDPAPEVTADQPVVMAAGYAHEGALWVLAVNTQANPLEARLEVAGAEGPVEVLFEDRALTARDGAWSDSFGPYERRVYRMPLP